jgi:hypothetical protein
VPINYAKPAFIAFEGHKTVNASLKRAESDGMALASAFETAV